MHADLVTTQRNEMVEGCLALLLPLLYARWKKSHTANNFFPRALYLYSLGLEPMLMLSWIVLERANEPEGKKCTLQKPFSLSIACECFGALPTV
jgi:hypothetical protein